MSALSGNGSGSLPVRASCTNVDSDDSLRIVTMYGRFRFLERQ